ncbi:NAD-dependent succinate-semialdehyde dehydrogenase [Acidihalobacter ferrooxydans]|uniref:NAD-dependent succinate-semialdehyde dehydrogenase n=1 Tax=Acidihalobacter ferrooxydans TaxID=1765967 RepID=A0A1P8UFZ7_9GAMM|nr:NAD-dependent succinate-semialdehyde dehydrogenase [Acidihalobacter ferrooxydans]APZ42778.1 NAD-dependent succinate-semialdehyde dehydrogenase [Acidihalobacter ferrooxydans]
MAPQTARTRSHFQLDTPHLWREQAWLAGHWTGARETLAVTDPATGETIGHIPSLGEAAVVTAIDAAAAALPAWAALTPDERADRLLAWYAGMRQHREDLARIMTLEEGKPLAEARGEIDYAASFVRWFAEEGRRAYGETIPSHLPGRHLHTLRQPIGVTAAITPWNFPSAMVTRKAAAALAAGCPMLVRPASETPYSALALARLAEQAGIPGGIFQVITGDGRSIASALMRDTRVRALSFTGSTEVGKALIRQSADTVKRLTLELGGNAPFIVFDDVDLDAAVDGALAAKFQTSGEDCLAANRILVQRPLYAAFLERFAARTAALRVGHGLEPDTDIGPLIDARAVAKADQHVSDARERGARVLTGGKPLGGNFYAPTVVADVTPDMALFREETFSPVAAVLAFDDEAEAVRLANDTEYGLVAYCYTADLGRATRLGDALDYGMVAINCAKLTGPPIPFGGVKQSGQGREGSRHGLDEYSELKYICLGLPG